MVTISVRKVTGKGKVIQTLQKATWEYQHFECISFDLEITSANKHSDECPMHGSTHDLLYTRLLTLTSGPVANSHSYSCGVIRDTDVSYCLSDHSFPEVPINNSCPHTEIRLEGERNGYQRSLLEGMIATLLFSSI